MQAPPDYRELEDEIAKIRKEKEAAIEAQQFERAAKLRDREKELLEQRSAKEQQWRAEGVDLFNEVNEESIAEVLALWTGIPVYKLTEEETAKLLRMEEELHKRVIGQHDAIKAVSQAIRRTRAGLKDPKRPSGSFIFLGPSGVGKTETAKTLAEFLFGDENSMIQLDMSEYMEKHRCRALSVRRPATSVTTKAVNSPRPCAASPSPSCSSTRSKRRTPTSSTRSCRFSKTVA